MPGSAAAGPRPPTCPNCRRPFERRGLAGRQAVAYRLQVGRHLSCQHLDEAGTEHADGGAVVADVAERGKAAVLVHRAAGDDAVTVIEGREIEALCRDEHAGDKVAAAARDAERRVVAAGATVGILRRDAVEIAWEVERAGHCASNASRPRRSTSSRCSEISSPFSRRS
jgi:hypothetical protein